jgi:DNA-binding transcriptional ArsR family regulator
VARKRKRAKRAGKRRRNRQTEARIAYSVLHPVRLDILSTLFVRVAGRKELAKTLGKPLSTVSFHLKQLLDDNVIELVGEEPHERGTEFYYRAPLRPELGEGEIEKLPRAARRRLAAVALQAIVTEGLAALRHGQMDADDELRLDLVPLRLSSQGRAEVSLLQAEMLERLEAIAAEDADRPEEDAPVRIAALLWFERGRPAG